MRWIIAVLLVAGMAGCAEESGVTPQGATSKAVEDQYGRSIARAWASDARLAGLFGYEPGDLDEVLEEYGNATVPPEDVHGDGRAVLWGLNYTSTSRNETLFLILDGVGNEMDRHVVPGTSEPLPKFRLDSVAAVRVLHEQVENFTQRMDNRTDLFYGIEHHDNGTDWAFIEFQVPTFCVHVVGADNGTLWYTDCLDFDFDMFEPAESGAFNGQLTALASSQALSFTLQQDHDDVMVALRLARGVPLGSVTMEVTGVGGAQGSVTLSASPLGNEISRVGLAAPAGTYALSVSMSGGTVQEFDVFYCTSGVSFTIVPSQDPCTIARAGSEAGAQVAQRLAWLLGLHDATGQ